MNDVSMDGSDFEDNDFNNDEEYDELDPNFSAPGKRSSKQSVYQLKNVLKLPRATTYSTQALYDQIHAGDIDLEPEYQRDVVWPESKQIGLIDSILRNFYVPPIIFVAHQHDDGAETKTCIDGKQRLTSIHRFMDGLIPHRDMHTGTKYWYKNSATSQSGRSPGQLLPDKYRRLFANKQIVCIEYQDLPDSDEREIFQRVQLGMALTPAEKLQVLNTPMSSFIRKIQSEYLNLESPLGSDALDWDRSRGGDFRCLAQALYVIAKYPASTSIGAITQLEKWLHNPTPKPNGRGKPKKKSTATTTITTAVDDPTDSDDLSKDQLFLARIHDTFQTFSKLVSDPNLRPLFLKPEWRVSPVEFVMMCLLISVEKEREMDGVGSGSGSGSGMTSVGLAKRIGEMRVRVRTEHVDIRMNARVAKTMFDFIKGSGNGAGASTSSLPTDVPGMDAGKSGMKRKREEEGGLGVDASRKEKERKEDERGGVGSVLAIGRSLSQSQSQPQTPTMIPPPRPDRLLALREAKKAIAPPRVTPPVAPAALR